MDEIMKEEKNMEIEREFDEEETKQQTLEREMDLLEGLLAAADYAANEELTIEISRNGKTYFSFTVHPLSEDELVQIRKRYTKHVKNKRSGIRVAEEVDAAKLRCSIIYNSTIDSDKEKIWNNKELWEGLRKQGHVIINALDAIEAVLLPGEKERIIKEIDLLGGFEDEDGEGLDQEDKQIETAKNL